jgi:hypothetical protein
MIFLLERFSIRSRLVGHIETCRVQNIYVWVDENSNKLVSFEVKGQGHGEIDMPFLIK